MFHSSKLIVFICIVILFQNRVTAQWFEPETVYGKFDVESHYAFTQVDTAYTFGKILYLRHEANAAFTQMVEAAKLDGVDIKLISAFRSFEHQKRLWENKWTGKTLVKGKNLKHAFPDAKQRGLQILQYTALPGTSRHHWGTEIDINSVSKKYFKTKKGQSVYQWMKANAAEYGFYQTYTAIDKHRPNGFMEEKWHWTYLPTAKQIMDYYVEQFRPEEISGFKGSSLIYRLPIMKHFILGINPVCK